MNHMLKAMNKT